MGEVNMSKQSVGGFKIIGSTTKSTKDGEKIRLTLEGLVEDITAGDNDMGKVLKAFLDHQTGQVEVGLTVFVK